MKTEIVRRRAGDPERGADKGRVVADRQNTAAEAALTAIGIANPADRQSLELFQRLGRDTLKIPANGQHGIVEHRDDSSFQFYDHSATL